MRYRKLDTQEKQLDVAESVRQFISYKKASGLSPRTLDDYSVILAHFFKLHPDGVKMPRQSCLEYLARYENPCSYNLRFAYLKCFWDWCIHDGVITVEKHPLDGLKKRKPQGRIIQLEESEVSKLLKQADISTYAGLRDYALMCLSIDTGIRPYEALQLMPDDFRADRQEITVRREIAKTRQPRTLPLSTPTTKKISDLLKARPKAWGNVNIFCSETGTELTVSTWSKRVLAYSQKAGITRVTAYSLRHTAALLLLRHGADAFTVQKLLGHADMQMTRNYVNLTCEDTRRNHAKAGVISSLLSVDGITPPINKPSRARKLKYPVQNQRRGG